mmetsp:Transcript_94635/g.267147  ORF Transcript_94635/g.267147 Transcript_94635/m.267147 type:complete len:439 (-) Transcript_94635:170-1486(-)
MLPETVGRDMLADICCFTRASREGCERVVTVAGLNFEKASVRGLVVRVVEADVEALTNNTVFGVLDLFAVVQWHSGRKSLMQLGQTHTLWTCTTKASWEFDCPVQPYEPREQRLGLGHESDDENGGESIIFQLFAQQFGGFGEPWLCGIASIGVNELLGEAAAASSNDMCSGQIHSLQLWPPATTSVEDASNREGIEEESGWFTAIANTFNAAVTPATDPEAVGTIVVQAFFVEMPCRSFDGPRPVQSAQHSHNGNNAISRTSSKSSSSAAGAESVLAAKKDAFAEAVSYIKARSKRLRVVAKRRTIVNGTPSTEKKRFFTVAATQDGRKMDNTSIAAARRAAWDNARLVWYSSEADWRSGLPPVGHLRLKRIDAVVPKARAAERAIAVVSITWGLGTDQKVSSADIGQADLVFDRHELAKDWALGLEELVLLAKMYA